VTPLALEYQPGQAVAPHEVLPDLSRWGGDHDVVVGEEVGLLGHDACGQWTCAERCWMSSMIDMIMSSVTLLAGRRRHSPSSASFPGVVTTIG
jgi:hypothetical protein